MKEPKINAAEWQAELDRFRKSYKLKYTKEVWDFIEYARNGMPPIKYKDLAVLLKKRFGAEVNWHSLAKYYHNHRSMEK